MASNRTSRSPASTSRIDQVLSFHNFSNQSPRPSRSPSTPHSHRGAAQLDGLLGPRSPTLDPSSPLPNHPPRSVSGLSMSAGSREARLPTLAASVPTGSFAVPITRTVSSSFTPRIIRGSEINGQATRTQFSPPPRPHRSNSLVFNSRSHPASVSRSQSTSVTPNITHPIPPISFLRPSYLDNSSLRDLLHSEVPPTLPPNRYRFDGMSNGSSLTADPKRTPLVHQGTDSDDDRNDPILSEAYDVSQAQRVPSVISLRLPTRWSESDRNPNLSVSSDGAELTFNGPLSNGDREAAAARTNFCVPPACGIYYYEVEILNKGAKGHISIGFSSSNVRLNRLPGWEGQSWGYHGDDGQVFASEGDGKPYGPMYTSGDIIGCGIDFSIQRMFYTKNGTFLDLIFENVGATCELFPSVGLRTPHESIRANFGQNNFKFDIDSYVRQERTRVWKTIQATPIELSDNGANGTVHFVSGETASSLTKNSSRVATEPGRGTMRTVDDLVLAYLTHYGYVNAARAMKRHRDNDMSRMEAEADDMELDTDADEMAGLSRLRHRTEDSDIRTGIVNAVRRGDINAALAGTKDHYPVVLDADNGLIHFKLRCRKLVELILDFAETLKRVRSENKANGGPPSPLEEPSLTDGVFEMEMDLDGSSSVAANGFGMNGHVGSNLKGKMRQYVHASPGSEGEGSPEFQTALNNVLEYGQTLRSDYEDDKRELVVSLFNRCTSLMAFPDPREAIGDLAALAGEDARAELAAELNRAILASQGLPTEPTLDLLYRQACTCIKQLGYLGGGAAAFGDARREFLES